MAYVTADYQFLRVYKSVNYVGRKLLQKVFFWGFILPPNETLTDYIKKKQKFSNRQYKARYDDGQRKKIEVYNVHGGSNFDVSIWFKLIQDTSNNIALANNNSLWNTQNFLQLEYLLYKVKTVRNDLTHNPLSLDRANAELMIEENRTLFLYLLDAAGSRYAKDVTNEKTILGNEIDELISHPLMESEIQQLFREQIHERSKEKMIKEGAVEMKEKYKQQSDLNPLTPIDGTEFRLPVLNVYKKLEIQECGRNAKNKLIDSNDLLRLDLSCETVNDLNKAVDLVILEGPTGSGKTTVTKLLLAEWSINSSSLIKGLLEYDLVIFMECRNTSTESLTNLLHCLMPLTYKKLEVDPIKIIPDCTVLMIIDSLDELNDKSENLFKELLDLLKMKNITGICTMRPTKAKDVLAIIPPELRKVRLQSRGIPEDQRGPFVEMYHSELSKQGISNQSTQELIQHLKKSASQLQEHLRFPINLVHLVYLWAIAPQKVKFVTTATELYTSIHEVVQMKLSSESLMSNSHTKNLTHEEREKNIVVFLETLYTEAMLNLTRQQFCILPKDSEVELKKVCRENKLPQSAMLSAFLVTKSLWTGLHAVTEYSISHTDMQEYLAARCIFKAFKNKGFQNKLKIRIGNQNQCGGYSIQRLGRSLIHAGMNILSNSPVTDILKLFFPNIEIPFHDYQNVLKHLVGLFVLDVKPMSKVVSKDLVKLFKESGMEQPEDWLDVYAETKSQTYMVKYLNELCGDVLSGDIIVRDSRLAAYTKLVTPEPSTTRHGDVVDSASFVKANSLIINLKNPTAEHPDLQELIHQIINLKCSVEMHLYHDWRKSEPGNINVILNETHKRCDLQVVRGSPSSSELHIIKSTLKKLYISIRDDSHAKEVSPMLRSADLPNLRAIYFHSKYGNVSSESLQPLIFGSSTIISLFLSDVDDSNVAWAVNVASALQQPNGEFECLYLPNNKLTSQGFINLVNGLHQSKVKILVRIGVTSDIVDENLDEPQEHLAAAKAEARNKLKCDIFWYFNAKRMEGW